MKPKIPLFLTPRSLLHHGAKKSQQPGARGNFSFKKKLARISLQRRLYVDEVGDGGGGGACVTREC